MGTDKNIQAKRYKLENRKYQIQNKINKAKSNINSLDERIVRLQRAYDTINALKDQAISSKNKAKKLSNKKYQWKGNHYNSYKKNSGFLVEESSEYVKSLDRVQDSINYEIRNLRNAKEDQWGLIGYFNKQIRNIKTEIQNLFN